MEKQKKVKIMIILLLVIIAGGIYFGYQWLRSQTGPQEKGVKIVYGISPYQDTILPIVAQKKGWYREEGLDVQLKVLAWGDVMNAVAAGAVDVAIQNFNSFQAAYNNISDQGGDVIFYYPLFIFKGAAIMIRSGGNMKTLQEMLGSYPDREAAIVATVKQLKGKKIATTKGTEMEQIVLSALKKASLEEGKDVKIINAQPDDALRAFLNGDVDAFSGGVTERTEAMRHGATEMIEASDLAPPVIDGLVTSKKFAEKHEDALLKLIKLWFRTIQFMDKDLDTNSKLVIDYLSTVASTKYSVDEYKYTWLHTEVYPKNLKEMEELVVSPNANYFWKKSWDANNEFLVSGKQIPRPVPYEASWIERINKLYNEKYGGG